MVVQTAAGTEGHGLTFTLGRGTEVIVAAVHALSGLVLGKDTDNIFSAFGAFWRSIASESQLRWVSSLLSMHDV